MDQRRREVADDYPPHSRLFIVCGRNVTEDMLSKAFGSYGYIEDIFIPKDHNTGVPKGLAYIKFRKTSEAAYALEGMHGTMLEGGGLRPLKVMVASNRSDIQLSDRERDSMERFMRLFITVPKTAEEEEIANSFSDFGTIRSVDILKDHETGKSKGFAYVNFENFSNAAIAFEQAEKKYKAVFAQPKQLRRPPTNFESNINSLADAANNSNNMYASLYQAMDVKPEGYTRVKFMCSPYVTPFNAHSIFDLVPGLVDCQYAVDLMQNCGKGIAFYANPTSAAYAVQKIHNFEYPPGQAFLVRPDFHSTGPDNYQLVSNKIPSALNTLNRAITSATNSGAPDLAKLAEAIAEASKLVQMATLGSVDNSNTPDENCLNYCSVKLPDPKPLAHIDSPMVKRCFLVCKPKPPPLTVLRDIFCRFGNLITVYALNNKTVGYACYANAESADEARKTLHGAEVMGVRIKVLEAEEENTARSRKRRIIDT